MSRLAVSSDASLFSHDGTDHRLTINRAGDLDTASIVFQSAFSGRAEIGLTGSDALTLNMSPDGSTFLPALSVSPASGYIGAGTEAPASRLHVRQSADARITIDTMLSGSGGGFDIINSADAQSWRITGHAALFKLRDHTAGLDKLVLNAGASGNILLQNCGNVGIGATAPTARLQVDGAVRIGAFPVAGLPGASASGAGSLVFVPDASGGACLAISDGAQWRRSDTYSVVS